jgi:hypothetical protein
MSAQQRTGNQVLLTLPPARKKIDKFRFSKNNTATLKG